MNGKQQVNVMKLLLGIIMDEMRFQPRYSSTV